MQLSHTVNDTLVSVFLMDSPAVVGACVFMLLWYGNFFRSSK